MRILAVWQLSWASCFLHFAPGALARDLLHRLQRFADTQLGQPRHARCNFREVRDASFREESSAIISNALYVDVLNSSSADLGESLHAFSTRESFLARYGQDMVQVNNGQFGPGRRKSGYSSVADVLLQPDRERHIFGSDDIVSQFDARLWQSMHRSLEPMLPPALADFVGRRIASVGTVGSATYFHSHDETWLALLSGAKAWWVITDAIQGTAPALDPCHLLGNDFLLATMPQDITFCLQLPGEVVYVGKDQPHATCNLHPFTVGFGAQGHTDTWPSLIQAAHRGNWVSAYSALDQPANNINERLSFGAQKGQTALHRAAQGGRLQVAELLIQRRASAEQTCGNAVGPIHIAAQFGHVQLVKMLAAAGAEIESQDGAAQQPVHFAALGGHTSVLHLLAEHRADLAAADLNGNTPLHGAALVGHSQVLKLLIALRASILAVDELGRTPMDLAHASGHGSVVRLLQDGNLQNSASYW